MSKELQNVISVLAALVTAFGAVLALLYMIFMQVHAIPGMLIFFSCLSMCVFFIIPPSKKHMILMGISFLLGILGIFVEMFLRIWPYILAHIS